MLFGRGLSICPVAQSLCCKAEKHRPGAHGGIGRCFHMESGSYKTRFTDFSLCGISPNNELFNLKTMQLIQSL